MDEMMKRPLKFTSAFITAFAKRQDLSDAEIEEIRRIIENKEGETCNEL